MLIRQHLLKRRHISAEFNNVFDFPLVVAVAAMGYGKTTAAKDFLKDAGAKYAWVSIESDESSPQYIWDSITRQLAKATPELGSQLRALGFPVDAPQRDKIINIIEEHTYSTDTILVIDDYHNSHSPEFDRLLERIIRINIEGFHILLLSRTIPDLNIDELRLKGYCYMIKNNLFELSKEEIKEYFILYGFSLSEEIIFQIFEISEGWISAVYLIMQRYAEINTVEPGRSIERLFETTVMSWYTAREVQILKSLCVLDSFSPQQAAYVTNEAGTEKIIRQLSYGNSFIRYDEIEGVYRIHNIFNNYLRKLLEGQTDIDLDELYKRSGQWYIRNGEIVSGLKYLLKAKEYDLILSEFESSRINLVIDNNSRYILKLFEHIPIEVKYRHPLGYLAYIGFFVTNVDKEVGARLLADLEQYCNNNDSISPSAKKRISGEVELIRAYIAFNDAALMRKRFTKAHEMLQGRSVIANKDKIITFGSPHSLYLYYREKGKFQWARDCVVEMFPYYSEMADGCGKGFDYLLQAEYYLETGDLVQAELCAYKAIYKAKSLNQVSVIICAQLALARACAAKGKFDEAHEIMDELREEVDACNSPILSSAFDLCAGYIGGITEREHDFAKWLRSGDMEQSEVLYQGMGFNYIIFGKYLLLKKEYIQLEVICEEMRHAFAPFNNLLGYLHSYIFEAVAKFKLYGMEKAGTPMLSALDIGRSDDILLPMAEYGIHVMEILKGMQKDAGTDDYLERLLSWVSCYVANAKKAGGLKAAVPLLTNREKEILELVVAGKTNREIASELFVAEVTVRKNITCIYRKLDVTGRASAVKKAMELKII